MLAAILHDVKAYDPRDHGLNHLAIHGDTLFPDRQPFTGEVGYCGSNRTIDTQKFGRCGVFKKCTLKRGFTAQEYSIGQSDGDFAHAASFE
ncbi:uncharacterized protein Bfra_006350 [Botrytis fragariae]|uniref:Uncharacterized protein n=1 Tax=Botrytis fragariae TaxID=1964551 RepID=A0A8H6B489_9HELO|nr:uncharacterized protein Bfra_006350 [Botrytis fragariae]KAF5879146.1 hypothetical protein Bfra_006350 [Botrytis fragariae]